MFNRNGHNNGNGGHNGAAVDSRNGNGHKPDAAMPGEHELLWDGLPPAVNQALEQPLDPSLVSRRRGHGGKFYDYLEGHVVFEQANRIFGRGAWGYDQIGDARLRRIETVDPETGEITDSLAYSARVRVSVAGALPRTDTGFHAVAEKTVDGHDTAIKGAVTDGVKRAFRSFGVQFGNGFYGGQSQANAVTQPERAPVQASGNGKPAQANPSDRQAQSARNASQVETLRKRLMELCAKQGFDEAQIQAAVQRETGKGIDDLTVDEIGSLIEAAANKLNQMRQAQAA